MVFICRPLHDLLKKGANAWSDKAQITFQLFKKTLVTATSLAVPDCNKQFVVKTKALSFGVEAVAYERRETLSQHLQDFGSYVVEALSL